MGVVKLKQRKIAEDDARFINRPDDVPGGAKDKYGRRGAIAGAIVLGVLFFSATLHRIIFTTRAAPAPAIAPSRNTTEQNSTRTHVYVVTLQGVAGADEHNAGRLDRFFSKWEAMCGRDGPAFTVCPGIIDKRKGYGLTRTYINCLDRANATGAHAAFFLEDDALPFDAALCTDRSRAAMMHHAPDDAFLVMLERQAFIFTFYYFYKWNSCAHTQCYFNRGPGSHFVAHCFAI